VQCSHCRASIVFLPTPNGKQMPIDAGTVQPEHQAYDPKVHQSHFATCTSPNQFRKKPR
jgi:hypothetical protein